MSKITAIHSGGGWHDASVDYLVVPGGVNLDEQCDQYQRWYREVYCSGYNSRLPEADKQVQYMTFRQWLRKTCGARDVNENELEIFEDM